MATRGKRTTKTTEAAERTEMTLEEALRRIAELEEKSAREDTAAEDTDRVRALESALIASRGATNAAKRLARESTNEEVYAVTSLVGAMLSAEVTDSRGAAKRVTWDEKGAVEYLTAGQIAEVKSKCPFFDTGYLSAPEVVPVNPNQIESYDTFIEGIDINTASHRIDQIDSPDVLWGLFHFIENSRFEVVTEEGRPTVKAKNIAGKAQVVHFAVMQRLRELTGINLSANDG
jgi:hypothetical protein